MLEFGEGRWRTWPIFCVSRTGMPYSWLAPDEEEDEPAASYETAREAGLANLRKAVGQEPFREAVTWQNPYAAGRVLDLDHARRKNRRRAERTAGSYLARYTAKNDSIGFYGPVCFGAWTDGLSEAPPVAMPPRNDSVFLEVWAVREVAAALLKRHDLWQWTMPALAPAIGVAPGELYLHDGSRIAATGIQERIIGLCDGRRTIADVIASCPEDAPEDTARQIRRMQAVGILSRGYAISQSRRPERQLRRALERIADPVVKKTVLAELDTLLDHVAKVQAAAGSAEEVAAALRALGEAFKTLTDISDKRRHGEFYAGRSVVYEDCLAPERVMLSTSVLDRLAPCLDLLLTSARWFSGRVAELYLDSARAILREHGAEMPLPALLQRMNSGFWSGEQSFWHGDARPVDQAAADLRARWTSILRPAGSPIRLAADEIRAAVRTAFPASGPAWPTARWHSPDLMIAARSAQDIDAGRFLAVMGEMHATINSVDQLCVAGHAPDPRPLAEFTDDDMPWRIVPLYPFAEGNVNSRTSPPDYHRSPDHLYLGIGTEASYHPPGARLEPAGALRVAAEGSRLVVRSAIGDFRADLVEVLDAYLSAAACSSFGMLEPASHRPRVTIDDVVVSRESWTVPLRELPLKESEPDRIFAAMRELRDGLGLPRRVYCRISGQVKPVHADLANPLIVDGLWLKLRRGRDRAPGGNATFTEMLPGPRDLWLRDREGRRYTAEFRLVCSDPVPYKPVWSG